MMKLPLLCHVIILHHYSDAIRSHRGSGEILFEQWTTSKNSKEQHFTRRQISGIEGEGFISNDKS